MKYFKTGHELWLKISSVFSSFYISIFLSWLKFEYQIKCYIWFFKEHPDMYKINVKPDPDEMHLAKRCKPHENTYIRVKTDKHFIHIHNYSTLHKVEKLCSCCWNWTQWKAQFPLMYGYSSAHVIQC